LLNTAGLSLFLNGTRETLFMTLFSSAFAYLLGLPLGVALFLTGASRNSLVSALNKVLGVVTNLLRSVPFIILFVVMIPVTRAIVGTSVGTKAAIVPLVISAAPFIARMVESSLQEVDRGVIEAAESMGSGQWKIISKVLLPEARPSLISGAAISVITIMGYSVIAGSLGAGGLGGIAINYGYNRFQSDIMWVAVILLMVIVQLFQSIGMRIVRKSDKRGTS